MAFTLQQKADLIIAACAIDKTIVLFDGDDIFCHGEDAPLTIDREAAFLVGDRRRGAERLSSVLLRVRDAIAGTDQAAKYAEYADKAASAVLIIGGTASADVIAEAKAEMVSLGLAASEDLAEPSMIAEIWLDKAAKLRARRTQVNAIERQALAALSEAGTAEAIRSVLSEAEVALAGS